MKVKLYRNTHLLGYSLERRDSLFNQAAYAKSKEQVQIYFIWGIKGIDRSMCHKTDWRNCPGAIVWDDSFDVNPYYAQKDLMEFCDSLYNMSEPLLSDLRMKPGEVQCFAADMDQYFQVIK